MMMKEFESGSSGNCSFLHIMPKVVVLFDLGISYKKLKNYFLEHKLDLQNDSLKILVCISHNHGDHWKPTTYKQLIKNKNLKVKLHFPQEDCEITWEYVKVSSKQFKHGSKMTNFFVIDGKYGYLTDCNPSELINVLLWEKAYDLDELFIESNYDKSYQDYVVQASIVNGYDVNKGFERHFSKSDSDYAIAVLKPKKYYQIHKSRRFYEEYTGNNNHGEV